MVIDLNNYVIFLLSILNYLTKDELYNEIGLKNKALFCTDSVDMFFKSLKEYTKTKGLKIESKKASVAGTKLWKYIIY